MTTRISFCITCKGRLAHVQRTLPTNLLMNAGFPGVEFVLLDYSSPDGLSDWVRETLSAHIDSAVLTYYAVAGKEHFLMAHAKNLAHRLARGEIVCNLDADNFTGPEFAAYLSGLFEKHPGIFARAKKDVKNPRLKGTHGRIALLKKDFEALGGYDEQMDRGWGYEDTDLVTRAELSGLKTHFIDPVYLRSVPHADDQRVSFYQEKTLMASRAVHERISLASLKRGQLVANAGIPWGAAKVTRNFAETFSI